MRVDSAAVICAVLALLVLINVVESTGVEEEGCKSWWLIWWTAMVVLIVLVDEECSLLVRSSQRNESSRTLGFPVLYGDASRPAVLQSAGISSPKAVMVMYTGRKKTIEAVQRLRLAFPAIPIYARAQDLSHLLDLKKAGATDAILEDAETSLQLGSKLLKGFGVMSDDVTFLRELVQGSMEIQAQEELNKTGDQEIEVMNPFQVRVADLVGTRIPPQSAEDKSFRVNQTQINHVMRTQGKVDQPEDGGELHQSEDVDGKGVVYCELYSENSFSISSEDAEEGEKIKVDPSTPCVTTSEGP
ncbi:hypothetical protein TEA_018927 [Camellia sinensis var. sinensis]|uniref:RCK N-terminal domain-containing protein n=1 Tax=Camellia sinensis var. sinensis TaxID=542762 RepID=A0A4S4EHY3_CAMSN|nr:hypothetical protein TEA_018927 [Camellia sinensis var. sinensis]